ncbi:DNA polymerase III subunit delta [Virgibacillus soli]|uniref:DNA polymerase III subunit delta n=1 Tax=Paracerasibacillus soli TaxID=480284 RepID=A0ABU5CRP7_9BACI|nr:DNA polymerase III subunit delta [Virgibacillus soli]MDY0408494.1 DNA polymerase III subunit delta [Virgibacillus soli]
MNFLEMQKTINKKIPLVSLLYGTEDYFIQKLKDLIVEKSKVGEENIASYDLREVPIQEVITDAETYPFFGEEKVIFAYNPTFLTAKQEKLPFEHNLHTLEQYIQSPVDFSHLILIAPYEKLDERKKLTKLLRKNAGIVECNPIKSNEFSSWLQEMTKRLQIFVERDAAEILEAELSTNLQMLESELTKMALYVGDGGNITKSVVEQLLAPTMQSTSLRLVDAVIARDLTSAIQIFKDLQKGNEDPIALIGLLAFQFRMILRVKLLRTKGYGQSQIQKQIGAHPYVIKIAWNREKSFSKENLHTIMKQLAKTDSILKQGKMEKEIAFEMLLYDLITIDQQA